MAITRYQPSTELFRPFFEDFMTPLGRVGSSMRMPETDVIEREHEIAVICELAGMNADDIDISLENNVLTISGAKEERQEEGADEDTYHLTERRWGRFSRSFVLPREVEQERIEASFENGVLTVTIPKSEKARRRRIEIQGGGMRRQVETRKTGSEK